MLQKRLVNKMTLYDFLTKHISEAEQNNPIVQTVIRRLERNEAYQSASITATSFTATVVRNICQLLGLEINENTIPEQVESQLVNLKAAANKENMSLEEAARHLLEMRNSSEELGDRKFNKREYIKQRFGVDPEQAPGDSFVGMLYGDTDRGIQLGQLRHRVVLESSTLALEEFIFSGTGDNLNEFDQAQERINSRIDNDF